MQEPDIDAIITSRRQEGDAAIIGVTGEIDLHNSSALRVAILEFLERMHPKKLIVNLNQVPYMDSSAIAVLVEALQKIRRAGGQIYLTNLQPRVHGLLEIARLSNFFNILPTEEEALAQAG